VGEVVRADDRFAANLRDRASRAEIPQREWTRAGVRYDDDYFRYYELLMSKQRYVSQELTHFVGRDLRGTAECQENQYRLLTRILRQGELGKIHTGPGWTVLMSGKGVGTPISSNKKVEVQQVCFCDIPIEDLDLHMRKYSQFGLAFTKKYLVTRGATPVFYVSENSLITEPTFYSIPATAKLPITLKEVFDSFGTDWEQFGIREQGAGRRHPDLFSLETKLDWLFFAQLKFFDPTKDEDHDENFYMEREWRVLGTVAFTLEDVARVILPPSFAKRFRADVTEYWGQVTFSYEC